MIRSFAINDLKAYQIVNAIKIEPSSDPTINLSISQWTQSGNVISLANGVTINEGDKIYIQYQNNDGYVYAQLKKIVHHRWYEARTNHQINRTN